MLEELLQIIIKQFTLLKENEHYLADKKHFLISTSYA